MSFFAFFLIVVSLLSFVVAQLILKRAMEFSARPACAIHALFCSSRWGSLLMTVSFFITLGLLQRFDLSYLYPFQGLSVIFITIMAAAVLKERLSVQLMWAHCSSAPGSYLFHSANNTIVGQPARLPPKDFDASVAYESSGQSFSIAAQLILRIWSRAW